MKYWLFKTEPGCFSWQDLENSPDQTSPWDGVRNYQARNFMRAMRVGDQHVDPQATPEKPIWEMVDVRLRRALPHPLSRKELAAWPELSGMELMKRGSRLSVQPVDAKAFAFICNLAGLQRP